MAGRIGIAAAAAAALGIFFLLSSPATSQAPFADEIAAFVAADHDAPPPACATLFVGSSSFRYWTTLIDDMEPRVAINRGFGGSEMEQLNFYFDYIVAPYRPREILVYEGDNDLAVGWSADGVLRQLERFMELKTEALGATPVFYVSVKPSPRRIELLPEQTRLNALVAELAAERDDLVYVDIVTPMLGEDGQPRPELYIGDRLHMTPAGYALWARVIRKALDEEERSKAPDCE